MQIQFAATKRDVKGSGASRRLRRAGQTPGIIYGADKEPVSVLFNHNDLYHALQREAFHSSVLKITLGDEVELAILRDVQYHAYKQQVLHVDLQRVDATKKMHTKVPFHFVNADVCPGVKLGGGIVSHVLTELEIECLPGNLPEFIEVDLKDLDGLHAFHVSNLKLPEGVTPLTHGQDLVIAAIAKVRGAGEAAATAE